MKINKADLERIAVNKKQYPDSSLPEIAFAGRSNVGKSSFINSMVNRTNLARTSGKPGKTRTINFYNINDQFRFVDLPGYGYAQVSKSEKAKWGHIIEEYLSSRQNLLEVVLLVDIRHEPTELDLMMYNWIKTFGFTGLVIATKADKISKGKYQANMKIIRNKLGIKDINIILPYSSTKKINREEIWERLGKLLMDNQRQQP
ncbi:ribosome biogenesis GTP-binding protein YihA/YsxC [Clostridium sp. Cult3]|jgi:GTP-binding protein|uniref:ribosome biogenesis GTP-binding protein YihA/YsxC n=1 Tax=Clostridium sp. Cult3 TaxID=2079004 RepID=UPI001F012094|nr:ribosome biogenesis GTP-binding protein YihA/YsxC [Clostridium sp. Cult3]MCF6460482.1 YihA family ribosome biogenesis GTP-binding protein [Clostridium sp. Cult3]